MERLTVIKNKIMAMPKHKQIALAVAIVVVIIVVCF